MPNNRYQPARLVWGDALDQYLDLAYGLDDPASYSTPRAGSEAAQAPSGVEDAWVVAHDQLLEGTARFIPQDGTVLVPNIGRRHSGWDDPDGWGAALVWLRGKKKGKLYVDARNLLLDPTLATDTNADGHADVWTWGYTGAPTVAFSIDGADKAQRIDLTAGAAAGDLIDLTQHVYGVVPNEPFALSVEYRTASLVNGEARIHLQFQDAAGNAVGVYDHVGLTGAAYARVAVAGTAPAGATQAVCYLRFYALAAGATGSVWWRNAQLERAAAASATFIDQPGGRDVLLVEPMADKPEPEDDFTRRLRLVLRAADGSPFTGY